MTFRRLAIVLCVGCLVFFSVVMARRGAERSPKPAGHKSSAFVDTPVVAIDASDGLYVNAIPTRPEDLVRRVRQTIADAPDKRAYVRADKTAHYATVLDTMEELRAAGIEVSLITRSEENPFPTR